MSDTSSNSSSGGIGLLGALFITFLVLKLTHVIDWSWWWVTAPLWGPAAIVVAFLVVASPFALFSVLRKSGKEKRLRREIFR